MCMRCYEISRRAMLAGGGAVAASLATGSAHARVRPADMKPLIGPGYRPTERDEIGFWQQMDRIEEEVAGSNILVKEPEVVSYVTNLIRTVGGPAAQDMRIYIARDPNFNAVMFPSGMAIVFSGLLLRARNEAQLAGVIAHESGHFLRRHLVRSWRDQKRKTDLFAIGSMVAGVAGGATGIYAGDIIRAGQLGTILSLLQYSRAMEAEADAIGARLLAENGYPAIEMARVWRQLINEMDASALHRRKTRDKGFFLTTTHPLPESREKDLIISAAEVTLPGRVYDARREQFLRGIGPIRKMLLDDQVKLNDPGASQYLIETLAQDGWNGLLRFYEAEIWRLRNRSGDDDRAAQGYAVAVSYPDAPPEAWRWHGLSLMKAGRTSEARAALTRYLAMQPGASDAPYIRQMIG